MIIKGGTDMKHVFGYRRLKRKKRRRGNCGEQRDPTMV